MSDFYRERRPSDIGNGLGVEIVETDIAQYLSSISSQQKIGKLESLQKSNRYTPINQ